MRFKRQVRTLAPLALAFALVACGSTPPAEASESIEIDGSTRKLSGTRYLEYRIGAVIEAPPEVVWSVLTDADAYPQWNSTVVSVIGTIAKDETIELTATIDPERTFELNVSTFDPEKKLVWQDGGSTFKGVRTFTLTDRGDGTTEFTMAEVFTGSMMGMIEGSLPDFTDAFTTFTGDLQTEAKKRAVSASGV